MATYKRLLALISNNSESADPQELPEFKEFEELHRQLTAAQQKAVEDLQACQSCGHLVLPIDVEESLFQHIRREQSNRVTDGVYTPLGSSKLKIGRAQTAKLIHVEAYNEASRLPNFVLTEKILPRALKSSALVETKEVDANSAKITSHANILADADALLRLVRLLKSNSKYFLPLEVISSPLDMEKRVVLLHKPLLGELFKDNRLRAQEFYTEACKQVFVKPPRCVGIPSQVPESPRSDNEAEGGLTIDASVVQQPPLEDSPSFLK